MAYIKIEKAIAEIDKGDLLVGNNAEWAKEILYRTPTADVEEVKHGQWLPQIVCGTKVWDCSECKTLGSPDWKRCPICEAKMDGGKEVRQNDL